ncbi:hypothetical protein [Methylomonas sp. MK1]|uniref:hypothetical protein n=1 Tax=Methylomonas sp. MK1 TaxID=1131552 RepID=UPI000382DF17|nr:hypothetical protein [Methylomonas sp. MK1]
MNKQLKKLVRNSLTALIPLCAAGNAHAAILTFSLDYSGLAFGNAATAQGLISLDDQFIPNPGSTFLDFSNNDVIKAFTLTVSNATGGLGNGTFQMMDFDFATWDSAGETLDFSQQLMGQWTQGGGWGTSARWDGGAGEFNLYAKAGSSAPTSSGYFTLAANNDFLNGDLLRLVSFKPVSGSVQPVPLPAPIWLFGSAVGVFLSRKAVKKDRC